MLFILLKSSFGTSKHFQEGKSHTLQFFGVVQFIYTFIEGSCSRHAVLKKVAADVRLALKILKLLSTTRWACRAGAVSALRNNYPVTLLALEEITNTKQHTEVSANGHVLYQMKPSEFLFPWR
jgi:hypothetical protein